MSRLPWSVAPGIWVLLSALAFTVILPDVAAAPPRPAGPQDGVWLAEVVTDPKTDRDGSGSATVSDETVVLYNAGNDTVDLTGWNLVMDDSQRITQPLTGTLPPHTRHLILNPDDQMNNDVTLELLRPDGSVADRVALGIDVVDGDANDAFDEAVHLVGPWRGLKGPATGVQHLGAYWVRSIVAADPSILGPDAHRVADPPLFGPVWHASNGTMGMAVHAAPGATTQELRVVLADGTVLPLSALADGRWRTAPFPAADRELGFQLDGPDGTTSGFPGRGPFLLVPDDTAPEIAGDAVIANATGVLQRFPAITTEGAPLMALRVDRINNGTDAPLPTCRPTGLPHPDCRVLSANETIRIQALDTAGNVRTEVRAVVFDTDPPVSPTMRSETAPRPTLMWDRYAEPLATLRVEAAEDATGVWPVGSWDVAPDATTFTETTWTPGSPRAYRHVATDLAGNVATSVWWALPADAVPVVATAQGLGSAAKQLVLEGRATVVVTFDRVMREPPTLVFGTSEDRPFQLTATGRLDPSGRSAEYAIGADVPLPRSGSATWRPEGGQGADGGPVAAWAAPVSWDLEPPRLDVQGAESGWVRSARHTVALSAYDGGGGKPRVDIDEKPASAKVSGRVEARRVSLRGDGVHELKGRVQDPSGNVAPFVVRVAMDATPPVVTIRSGTTWSAATPIEVRVTDATSGVNATSLFAWVRNATASSESLRPEGTDGLFRLSPGATTWHGPFEVHVAVADQAGNLAEGTFGALPAVKAVASPGQEAKPAVHGPADRPDARPAPNAKGPGWPAAGRASTAAGDAAERAERLRQTYLEDALMNATSYTVAEDEAGPGGVAYGVLGVGGIMGAGLIARMRKRRRSQRAPPEVSEAATNE